MNVKTLILSFFPLLVLGACTQAPTDSHSETSAAPTNAQALSTPTEELVTSQDVTYFEDVTGYYVKPSESGSYPGVVMIHEWWGLNDHIKDMAKTLANDGYQVLAVDLFNGSVAQTPEQARQQTSSLDQAKAIENMNAAIAYLAEQGATKVGALGWCFGGGQSLQASLNNSELDATVIYYGNLVTDAAQLQAINWPVLGIFGDQDQSIPVESVTAFEAALNGNGTPNTIKIYEGVGHAFANPSNQNYAPEQTEDAWWHTREFLEEHLKEV